MKKQCLIYLTLSFLALGPKAALASGFSIHEHTARATAMAGAFGAVADDPGAIYYNPAGVGAAQGFAIEAGLLLINFGASYKGIDPINQTEVEVDSHRKNFFIPSLFTTYRLNKTFSLGLGVYAPYGLGMQWDPEVTVNGQTQAWWGRSLINKINLETVAIAPTVGIELHPRVYVGVGLAIFRSAVELSRFLSISNSTQDDFEVELAGSGMGVAANAGLLVKVIPDRLNLGFTYRGGTKLTFDGEAAFTKDGSSDLPPGMRTQLKDGTATAYLPLPDTFSIGLAGFITPEFTLGFALEIMNWSAYKEMTLEFDSNPELNIHEPKNWNNSVIIRLGAEYKVLPVLPLRAGFILSQSPVPSSTLSPELPNGDRIIATLGGGYQIGGFKVDLAYMIFLSEKGDANELAPLKGSYNGSAHLFSLSLGYALDM